MDLFTCPLPYAGRARIAQLNAYRSWARMRPRPRCVLMGDDDGTRECAWAFGFAWGGAVERDPFGTPLVSDLFARGEAACKSDVVAYVNTDIVLMDDFYAIAVSVANRFPGSFLLVGQRIDLHVGSLLAFTKDWRTTLRARAEQEGTLHQAAGIDYFVYRKGTLGDIPTFALGRWRWDNWIVWDVLNRGIPVIDATQMITAIHQIHDHTHHGTHGADQRRANDFLVRFTGGRLCTIADATHRLTEKGIEKV